MFGNPASVRLSTTLGCRNGESSAIRVLQILSLLLVAIAGCEGSIASVEPVAVEGRVLLANGQPLTAGRVVFVHREGAMPDASGSIRADGSFQLTTRDPADGAAPGQYKVRIEPARTYGGRKRRGPPFPLKYIDEDSSGLVVTVRAEPNRLEPIQLK